MKKTANRSLFGLGALAVSAYSLISFGLLGMGRSGEAFTDIKYWYMSGRLWLSGENPYDYDVFQKLSTMLDFGDILPFAYPPQSFSFFGFLGIFPYEISKLVWAIVNIISILLLAYFALQEIRRREAINSEERSRLASFLIPAIIIGNPITATAVWLGQTTIVVTLVLMYGFSLIEDRKFLIAGILISFATIKPQLAFLVVLWLILDKRWMTLFSAGISILVFSAIPILISGLFGVLKYWLSAMSLYQSHGAIASGLSYNTNISSLLMGIGFDLPSYSLIVFMIIGIGLTFMLWMLKETNNINPRDTLGLLLGISLLFFFGRDYDLVSLVPVLSSVWWHVRKSLYGKLFSLGLCGLLFLPHRLIEIAEIPHLVYWRIVVLIVAVVYLFFLSLWSCRSEQATRFTSI